MTPAMRRILGGTTVLVLALAAVAPAGATEYISRQEWPAIQRGIQVTQYTRLSRIVDQLDREPGSRIVILYPGGEAGHQWGLEIRNWFVALGIPSRVIALNPGSGRPDSVALEVDPQGFK
ncbi:MAG: hypothetical protein WB783_21235 [Arenicellales bacterium]